MFICGMMSVEILLSWRRNPVVAKLWLLVWSVTAFVLYIGHFVFFCRHLSLVPAVDTAYVACNLAVYPLYLIYIYKLTVPQVPRVLLWTLALPVIMGVAVGVHYLLMSPGETAHFVDEYLYHDRRDGQTGLAAMQVGLHVIAKVAFAVEVTGVVLIGTHRIKKYNQMIEQLYADTEGKALYSIHTILVLLLCTSVVSFVVNIIGKAFFADSPWMLVAGALLFSILLFAIGWEGQHQHFSIADIQPEHAEGADESMPDVVMKVQQQQTLRDQLVLLMEQERPYLNADLKLDDLAKRLGTNRTYLLRTMSDELHMTFSEYVNRQRIAYAKRLMECRPNLSKAEVAQLSGYASLSSFYRNFKQYA
jgi:AraC-like DNA-binding protein